MHKVVCILLFTLIGYSAFSQVWFEDFIGEANGATSGTASGTIGGTWSVTTTPSGGAATFCKMTVSGTPFFGINNTGSEGVWESNSINISALGEVALEIVLGGSFVAPSDYVRAFYVINGGAEVMFGEVTGSASLNITAAASAVVSGNTLKIVVRGMDNTAGTTFVNPPGVNVPNELGLTAVTVTDINVLYSIASTNWDVGTTWSTIGFAGAACNCTPDNNSRVIIGNNRIVKLNVAGTVSGLEIQNTGQLQWTNNNIGITMTRGGLIDVQTGGILTKTSAGPVIHTGTSIIFGAYNYISNINGAADVNTLTFNSGGGMTFNGSGTLTVADVSIGIGAGETITNNITGASALFSVTNDLNFTTTSTSSIFVNNGKLTAARILFDDDNVSFTNTATLTSTTTGLVVNGNTDDGNSLTNSSTGTFTVAAMNMNSGNFTINNSGIITQSGDFTNVDAGSAFNNLTGSSWSFAGSAVTNVQLFANSGVNNINTFDYSRAGNQTIIAPQDAYSNIVLSNSGTKTAAGSFAVKRNWSRTGATAFAPAGFTVTFSAAAGTAAQTIAAVGGETFAGLTINSAFVTSPQIILSNSLTVSGVLTMTAGNINMAANSITLSSSASGALVHSMGSAAGYAYGTGSFVRTFPTTAVAIGVDGFYPLGSSTNFRPFFIGKSSIAASSGTISVAHTNATTATDIAFTDNGIPGPALVNIQRRHDSFWTVLKSAGMVAGSFDLRAGGAGYVIGAIADIRLTRSSDATGIGTAIATTGSTGDVRANRTGLTAAPNQLDNNFYLSSLNKVNSPLPIDLIFYKAYLKDDEVISTWETGIEINNDFFTIEKTTDFEKFSEVGQLPGKANTQQNQSYSFVDSSPFLGKSYYRLKQTDFDGKFTFSKPVMIFYDGPKALNLKIYPNPYKEGILTIELNGLKDVPAVPLVIYNLRGELIFKGSLSEDGPGVMKKQLEFKSPLPQGLYILKTGKSLHLTRKLVIE